MEHSDSLLFVVDFGKHWMGGVYYVRNLLFTILSNEKIAASKIYLLCPKEHLAVFSTFERNAKVTIIERKWPFRKINASIRKIFTPFALDFPVDVIWHAKRIKATSIFPVTGFPFIGGSEKCIFWIPDFQHYKLPAIFSKDEIAIRSNSFKAISESGSRLLLSSQDASKHYREEFPNAKSSPVCIPFVSDIEDFIEGLNPVSERKILESFGLLDNGSISPYIYIPNQFWQHKNHIVAFEGFAEYCHRNPNSKLQIVCTGSTQDYRAKEYFPYIQSRLKDLGLTAKVQILEFIDRKSQIVILKNCSILLQPSLFEGWGTGVQEAKRFSKCMLLSNIPIHVEQGDERSVFFDPESPNDLATQIDKCLKLSFNAISESESVARYKSFARQYSNSAHTLFLRLTENGKVN